MASPYLGLEYGYGSVNHDFEPTFTSDNVTLNPDLEDGILSAFVGYKFNKSWAVELGYSQYDLDDGYSKPLGVTTLNGQNYTHEMDWDSSIKAKQLSVAPVYSFALDDKWILKAKASIMYTQYKSSFGKYEEFELVTNDDIEIKNVLSHHSNKTNKVGALVAFGAEYAVFPQVTVGANVKYQVDSYANVASVNVLTAYHF